MAVYSGFFVVKQMLALRGEENDLQLKKMKLLEKKAALESELSELQTREGIEREAKERFNLKMPGEKVVIVVPESTESATSSESHKKSFWERIMGVLFR